MTGRERTPGGDTHFESCNGTDCPCYQEGRNSVEVLHAHPGLIHAHTAGADPHQHDN